MLNANYRLKTFFSTLVGRCFQLLDTGRIHPARERARRALSSSVDFIDAEMPDALALVEKDDLLDFALSSVVVDGHYMEFGVYTGGTIRRIAGHGRNRIIHGFDSFLGLPEPWSGFNLSKGAFNLRGRQPRVPRNVLLHVGLFAETLPGWLEMHAGPVAFIHIDCDVYSSTRDVLEQLRNRIVPGTVILFDEYFNYPGWERHEHRAFREFLATSILAARYTAFARQQVAVTMFAPDVATKRCNREQKLVHLGSMRGAEPTLCREKHAASAADQIQSENYPPAGQNTPAK